MRLFVSAAFLALSLSGVEARQVAENSKQLDKSDGDFWRRFLQYNTMSLPPTPPPTPPLYPPATPPPTPPLYPPATPPPTYPPTPAPTAPPTKPPTPPPTKAPTSPPTSPPTPSPTTPPTPAPTQKPTSPPTPAPTKAPTPAPTPPPTPAPTNAPTPAPTKAPTPAPTPPPTPAPTTPPTPSPTLAPTSPPTPAPTPPPTLPPTAPPTTAPTTAPTPPPTPGPTSPPTPSPTSPPTPSPTTPPTTSPTPAPTPRPTPPPSPPTAIPPPPPTPKPTSSPTPAPTPPPTPSPTPLPTLPPTPPPSPGPTLPPTLPPTVAPTPPPTPPPSTKPTPPPTPLPTPPPTIPPSLPPTPNYTCLLDLNLYCQPPVGASSCDTIPPVVTQCLQRPTEITMLLYGGNCSQSFNIQSVTLFRCFDFNGGPPTTFGSQVFIVATDIKGEGIVYFSGFVNIGDTYTLSDNGNQVDPNMNITIYSTNNLSPSNIIETVVYHSSCSRNLFLGDRFGASQLVQFINNAQGVVSLFQNATYEFSVKLPLTLTGTATLTSLVSITNFGVFNFTDEVYGLNVSAGEEIVVSQPISLDLSKRRRYTALTTLTGVNSYGQNCSATDFTSFIAGNPIPPVFPTLAPSGAPSGTLAPTTNPLTTPCRLRTAIICTVPNNEASSCDTLVGPETTACSGNVNPSFLQFRYVGGNGFPDQVYISIVQGPGPIFQGVVDLNGFFNAYGPFNANGVPVVISTVVDGNPGQQLASFGVPTGCTGSDVVLYDTYGGVLQLSAFANTVSGLVYGFATVELDYILQNNGDKPVTVTAATVVSDFSGTNSLISSPLTIPGNGQVDLGNETAIINLNDAKAAGSTFHFLLNATGTASVTGFPCVDATQYAFSIH